MLFSITPPRRSTRPEKVKEIAEITLGRLAGLDLDGLSESERLVATHRGEGQRGWR